MLECARANGDIVSSRKGTLDLVVTVTGRASHAGVEPEKGRSAILEAARSRSTSTRSTAARPGVTVNVGVIEGGTRPNVVAERCAIEVDVRAVTREGLEAVEAAIRGILGRARARRHVEIVQSGSALADGEAGAVRPPGGSRRRAGRRDWVRAADAVTGGASDANTTAGMGVPTIDGLGPIGGMDHSPRRVPRGRLHRAADHPAGRADRRDRARPGGPRWRAERLARPGIAR